MPQSEDKTDWLQLVPLDTELEKNDDGSVFIPIHIVENMLDELTDGNWSRSDHKYSFHTNQSEGDWLATSHLITVTYDGETGSIARTLACASFIRLQDYIGNSNILQTGISEATKAGVKVLGSRFGKDLNGRTIIKSIVKEKKIAIKRKPDAKVLTAYTNALMQNNTEEIERLLSMYDIKTEDYYAKG